MESTLSSKESSERHRNILSGRKPSVLKMKKRSRKRKENQQPFTNSIGSSEMKSKRISFNLKEGECRAEGATVISSPHELKWWIEHKMTANSSQKLYYPVRVLPSTNSKFNHDSDADSSEDEYEASVEILSMDTKGKQTKQISTKRLVPYHNNDFGSDLDWHDICRSMWSEKLINQYIVQENLNKKKDQFNSFLHNILAGAKERAGYVEHYDGGKNEMEENELEEPYTQAIHMNSDESYDSDDDIRKILDHGKKYVAKEPIRPGDVIEYYCPVFVYGSKQGLRHATIMSVDPDRKNILELSNGELLDKDHKVKRIKVLSKFQGENMLLDHPGVTRSIEKFKLLKLKKPRDLKVETESDRLKRAIKGTIDTFMDNVKECDFAPTDMLVRFKGIEGMPDSSRKKIGKMKEILSQSDSEDSSIEMRSLKKSGDDVSSEESDDDIMISLRNQMKDKKPSDIPKDDSSSSSSKHSINSKDNDDNRNNINRITIVNRQDSDDESDLQLQLVKKKDSSSSKSVEHLRLNDKPPVEQIASEKENWVNLNSSSDESDIDSNSLKDAYRKSISKPSSRSQSRGSTSTTEFNIKISTSLLNKSINDSDSLSFHSDDSLSSTSIKECNTTSKKKASIRSTNVSAPATAPIISHSKKNPNPIRTSKEMPCSTLQNAHPKSKRARGELSPKAKPELPFFVKKFNNH